MKFLSIFLIVTLIYNLHAQNIQYLSGRISQDTHWSGQIYIDGDIIVQKGVTLAIDAGSRIIFKARQDKMQSGNAVDRVEFIVLGKLLAKGKPRNAKIIFTSDANEQKMNDWFGIIIRNLNDTSILQHCIIEYGYKGITCYGSSPLIEDCEVRFNYIAGISCEVRARPKILNSTIFGNDVAGINCELASFPLIQNCSIIQNTNGIMIFDRSQPDLGHNPGGADFSSGQNHISNNFEYNIYNHSTSEIYAQNNNWNTTIENRIKSSIYDQQDNPIYGRVLVLPVFRSQGQRLAQRRPPVSPERSPALPVNQTRNNLTALRTGGDEQNNSSVLDSGKVADPNGENEESQLVTGTDHEPLNVPTAPETLFAIRNVIPDEPPEEKNNFEVQEPIIEGLLDAGRREYLRRVKPEYPEIYKKTGHEGVVLMEVIVGRNGRVESYKILRSDGDQFTHAAIEAIKQYIYKPGSFRNMPVSFRIIERFKFQLSK